VSRRRLFVLALGFACIVAGLIVALALIVGGHGDAGTSDHNNNNALMVLLPVYASMIPIFIAAGKRRGRTCGQEKSNG
jgi:hypothetical protein